MRFHTKRTVIYLSLAVTLCIILWIKQETGVQEENRYLQQQTIDRKGNLAKLGKKSPDVIDPLRTTQIVPGRIIHDEELTDNKPDSKQVKSTSRKGNLTKAFTKIPHMIHQIWKTEYVPRSMANWIKSWPEKHPNWQYVFWTHDNTQDLIHLTLPEYVNFYSGYRSDIFKSDIASYFILYRYGGIYTDLDIECLRPVDPVIDTHPCLLSQEPPVHASINNKRSTNLATGALMACRPQHPFYKAIIQQLPDNFNKPLFEATGPLFLDSVAQRFISELNTSPSIDDVLYLAPPSYFHPTFDGNYTDVCIQILANFSNTPESALSDLHAKQVEDCKWLAGKKFVNVPEKHSYSNHHWVHTSYLSKDSYSDKPGPERVHIKDIVPGVVMASELLRD